MQQKKNIITIINSTANGRAAHTIPTLMKRITVLLALIVSFAFGARAAQYVFYYSGNYMYVNNNGQLASTTTFSTACIWEGTSGNKFLAVNSNGSTYYLRYNNGLTVTTNQNNATNWTVNGNNLYFQSRTSGSSYWPTSYYRSVRYNNGWGISNEEETNGWFDSPSFSCDCNVLYQVTTRTVESKTDTELTPASANVTLNPSTVELEKINDRAEFQATAPTITQKTYTIPEHKTYTFNNTTYYQSGSTISATEPTGNLTSSVVLNPTYHWNLSSGGNTYLDAGADGGTGWVQKKANPNADTEVIVSVWAVYGDNAYTTPTTTATITVMSEKYNPTDITADPLTLEVGGTGAISYTLKPTGAKDEITYNGYDNTIISIDANGVVKGLKAGITPVTLTAKKLDGTDGPTTTSTVTVTPKAPTIEFSLGANITATISTTETGATIYYTTDGTTPTTSSPVYTAPVSVTAGATVKAIVVVTVNGTQLTSPVAEALANAESGIVGNTVFLYDLEDHNWTYYSGVNTSVDGGNYNNNYAGKLYSPNPRNVKITYNANGGTVSIDESETSFVYFKTLEQGATAGQYPYTVISNPFSKRPTGKGFGGWKIISGGEYINGYNNGNTLPLDQEITFVNLPYPSTNCISAEIKLEATWVNLNNIVRRTNTGDYTYTATGGTYETNILVLKSDHTGTITVNSPCTIMMVEPDGSDDFRDNYAFSGYIVPMANGNTKIEFARWRPGNDGINPRGRNFTIGRGMVMDGTRRALYGTDQSETMNQILKVESGKFASFISYNAVPSSITKHHAILGCDYDRADENDENLTITGEMRLMESSVGRINSTAGKELAIITAKSGTFTSGLTHTSARESGNCFYLWDASSSNTQVGYRKLEIEGGIFWNIGGGMDKSNSTDRITLEMRIKGGTIKGAIFGGGATYDAHGHRLFVCTGGKIGGWIAPGANGIVTSGTSLLDGKSFVYIGGRTHVDSQYADYEKIDNSTGGNVFGAGCGYSSESTRGRVEQGTNVVIADEAYVQRGVYGGGAYGYCEESETANIYITGGHIGSVYDDQFDVYGGVYGGARQNRGGTVNIYMTGGQIDGQKQGGTSGGGVYGGSNVNGTISGNVTMQINGGQVGTSSAPANIHGGGYGQDTRVSGNVEVTLGTEKQATGGVTVYGDVYGGSALGYVNGTAATNTYHTHVTMNKGTINGSLYGGALGSNNVAANVYGPVEVKVHGGSVKATSAAGSGGVYGANNINGAPQRSVTVDIYGTDPAPEEENQYALHAVYGGGNQAPYTYGNGYPKVTVHNCDNSIEYVYGGGNAAAVAATDVTIYGGDVIGNVFGGGNGTVSRADVNGDATTKIYGGTILNVYGGSNSQGTIGGDINLLVNSQAEEGKDLCLMNIVNVFGGGNQAASKAGNISIVCTGDKGYIENVYGGANQANITDDIDLYINGGNIGNVFGGNNESGEISGNITVTVGNAPNEDCGIFEIGNVYGGGNLAAYSNSNGYPIVNMQGGTVRKAIFGGGYGESARVTGNPQVNVSGGIVGSVVTNNDGTQTIFGDIYGGGNMAPLKGNPVVTLSNNANVWSRVFGGGNNALVKGNTNVTMSGGVVGYTEKVGEQDVVRGGDIFGGGNAATIEGETNVRITNGRIGHNVYGGGNEGDVTGKTNVKVGE